MRRRWLDVALLLGVGLAALLFNGRLPITDRDEARYAVTSREMLATGDWVVPRLMGEVRTAKPPGVYWLQAASLATFGESVWAIRLPGALGVTLAAVVLRFGLAPVVGRRRARWTALATATTTLGLGVAKIGVTDGPLLLCASVAFVAILRLLPPIDAAAEAAGSDVPPKPRGCRRGVGAWWVLWIAVGLSLLLKGPVLLGVTIVGLGAYLLSDRTLTRPTLRRLRPTAGVFVALLVAAPWLVPITLREPTFLPTALGHDVFGRATRGLESHGQPPGFHLLLLPATFFPWSVLLPGALLAAWPRRRIAWVRWCLFATLGGWLVLEANVTKLPHYPLILFPPLALLVADWIVRATAGRCVNDVRRLPIAGGIVNAIGLIVAVATFALPRAVPGVEAGPALWALAVVALGWGVACWNLALRRRVELLAAALAVGFCAVVLTAYAGVASRLPMLQTSPRVAALLEGADSTVAMIEYKEPSLAWYAGQRGVAVREATPAALDDPAMRWAVITEEAWQASDARDGWAVVGRVGATLYNDGGRDEAVLVMHRGTAVRERVDAAKDAG